MRSPLGAYPSLHPSLAVRVTSSRCRRLRPRQAVPTPRGIPKRLRVIIRNEARSNFSNLKFTGNRNLMLFAPLPWRDKRSGPQAALIHAATLFVGFAMNDDARALCRRVVPSLTYCKIDCKNRLGLSEIHTLFCLRCWKRTSHVLGSTRFTTVAWHLQYS